ncbi:hypothetical protein LXA43DRAFT_1164138 [Ganoderma leucocontextum]|nr:hypothetical protein LXA43DRAFT_1164138 [Ganoderma leucocontextum]
MHPTLFPFAVLFALASTRVRAQTLVNGQIFTNGLAIVDAPAPGSPMHAGSVTQVAIDISGDGHLDQSASIPGSGQYTKQNITVSNGTQLLTQEQGSTVKHWSFAVSTCIPAGNYNLTFYEASHINGQPYFSITPYPVTVQNDHPTDACTNGTNALQDFPQLYSPPPQTPWLDGTSVATQPLPTATGNSASTLSLTLFSATSWIALGALLPLLF